MVSAMNRLALALLAVPLLAAGCGSSSSASSTSGSTKTTAPGEKTAHVAHGWTGLGATLADFEAAYPRGTAGCSLGKCFGSKAEVGPEESQYEYVTVETTPEGRVDGYEQALGGDEVIPSVAEHIVLSKFPHDTRVIESYVTHENGECKTLVVQSRTLGRWFANPKTGDAAGFMNIDLHGVNESGESTYPDHLSVANVSLGRGAREAPC